MLNIIKDFSLYQIKYNGLHPKVGEFLVFKQKDIVIKGTVVIADEELIVLE